MIEALHHRICIYIYMYYATRDPMLSVNKVYIRSCKMSIINGRALWSQVLRISDLAEFRKVYPDQYRLSDLILPNPGSPIWPS